MFVLGTQYNEKMADSTVPSDAPITPALTRACSVQGRAHQSGPFLDANFRCAFFSTFRARILLRGGDHLLREPSQNVI